MLPVIFGVISGTVTGLGMGGGTILILLLSLFMNLDQHIAQATNLIFFIPTSLAAIFVNLKHKNINFNIAIIISIFGVIGAIIGAKISDNIQSENLRKYFAIFILIIALHEIYKFYNEYRKKEKTHNNKEIK